MAEKTMRAVQFDEYGEADVLQVRDVPVPSPAPGEVLVEVKAAAINPGESAIRRGYLDDGTTGFPSGQGSDLAGVVVEVGDGVDAFEPGDEVLGYSWTRASQAQYAVVPVEQLVHKPANLPWEVAGSLYVAGVTAIAATEAVDAGADDVVGVSGAAGGVGSLVTQILALRGARVLGIASEANADWLRAHGAVPVPYGDGLEDRLRAEAPDGIDAFVDTHGRGYVDLALDLGVAPERIDTIIDFDAAQRTGVKAEGSGEASNPRTLQAITDLVSSGRVTVDIAATYPLDDVRDAVAQQETGHVHGKIVLLP